MTWLSRFAIWAVLSLWTALVRTIAERDAARAEIAKLRAELEAERRRSAALPPHTWHGFSMRANGPTSDIIGAWAPSGIITAVVKERSDDEVVAVVRALLARYRVEQGPPAVIEPGTDRPW